MVNWVLTLVSTLQVLLFAALFVGGNWLSSFFIECETWNATSIVSLLPFLAMLVYGGLQVSGRLLLARMSAWQPYFVEASMTMPPAERLAFARKCKAEQP
jgi:hypothetical protein